MERLVLTPPGPTIPGTRASHRVPSLRSIGGPTLNGVDSRPRLALVVLASLTIGGLLAGSSEASVSDDAGLILFYSVDESGRGGYALADPDTGDISLLSPADIAVDDGSVASTGEWAAVACDPRIGKSGEGNEQATAVCRVDLSTGDRTLIVDAGERVQHPTVAPDGQHVVFAPGPAADHGLKITSFDGGKIESLCRGFCPAFRFSDIAWSPDGTQVAFVATTPGADGHLPQIYVVTVGDSDYRALTNSLGVNADPAWSPDGSRIAFSSSRSGDTEIWVMNADGTDQGRLTDRPGIDIEPSWSPNGQWIVYTRHLEGSWDLATMPFSGGPPTVLTRSSGSEIHPMWLTDR